MGLVVGKGAPEVIEPIYAADSAEVMSKVQSELVNALDLLQNYQESRFLMELCKLDLTSRCKHWSAEVGREAKK